MYGKIKNGRLIISDKIILKNGNISIVLDEDEELTLKKGDLNDITVKGCNLESYGYKKIVYTNPLENKEGFEPRCYWEDCENEIIQRWEYIKLSDDNSGDLLVIYRNFRDSLKCINDLLKSLYDENLDKYNAFLKTDNLLNKVWKHVDETFEGTTAYKIVLKQKSIKSFFQEIGLIDYLNENGYVFKTDDLLMRGSKEIYTYRSFKRYFYELYSLKNLSNLKGHVYYNMSYIYMHTLFDQYILNIIKIITKIEERNLISKQNVTYEEILYCKSMEEVKDMIINKNIEEKGRWSYEEKINYLKDKGINFTIYKENYFDDMIYFCEKRNAIIHNNGEFNTSSLKKLKNTKYKNIIEAGQKIIINIEEFKKESEIVIKIANDLYELICEKYKLLNRY